MKSKDGRYRWGALVVLGLALTTLPVFAATAAPPPLLPIDLFFAQPRVVQVALSPSGDRVAYLLRETRGMSVWTEALASGFRVRHAAARQVRSLAWSTSGRGLFLDAGERVAYLGLDIPGGRATFVLALDDEREQRYRGVDPVLPDHVLVTEKDASERQRLLRIDTAGAAQVIFTSPDPIRRFVLDTQGEVRFVQRADGAEIVIDAVIDTVVDRAEQDDARSEVLRCGLEDACRLVEGIAPSGDGLLIERRLDGGRWGLVRLNTTTGTTTTVHQDPSALADLDSVALDPATRQPSLAVHHTERRRHVGLTATVRGHLGRIESALQGRDLYLAPRAAGSHWLVVERGTRTHHPRFHAYDAERRQLRPLLEDERAEVDMLPEAHMVERRAIVYRAGDGLRIHGFVSVPRGIDPSSAPLVAKIHGGPWNHVASGFDVWTQFLVNRGYVVFEPNFRGSTGLGLDYMLAARGEFGAGRVHQDIVDGVAYLTGSGLGDAERVAILGHSFGGFSALGGVAFSPEVFRAGVASAPAIDLVRALRDVEGAEGFLFELEADVALRLLLVDPDHPDGVEAELARLQAQSPEARVADTQRPVLMLAGGRDEKIDIVDVKHYAAALDVLGREVSLLVDDTAGHSFEPPRLRRALYAVTERFLAEHLGGRVGPLPDENLREYIASRMLLESEKLATQLRE